MQYMAVLLLISLLPRKATCEKIPMVIAGVLLCYLGIRENRRLNIEDYLNI
jgi:hypothetical protein